MPPNNNRGSIARGPESFGSAVSDPIPTNSGVSNDKMAASLYFSLNRGVVCKGHLLEEVAEERQQDETR